MRKVEFITCRAFADGHTLRNGNTAVELEELPNGQTASVMYLHGHRIAVLNRQEGTLTISDAGWQTNTTKSRINAILATFYGSSVGIHQYDWDWYLTGPDGVVYHWDGGATFHLGSGKPACELRVA